MSWASEPAPSSRAETGGSVEAGVGAALGVCHEHAETAIAQLRGGFVEVRADPVERHLHEQPARPGRPLRDQLQLALAHPADQLVVQLAPQRTSSGIAGGVEREPQLQHASVDLDRVGDAGARAYVRSGDDRVGALGDRRLGEVEAGVHVARAVVDPGKQMEVKIDVRHLTGSIGARGRHPVTLL